MGDIGGLKKAIVGWNPKKGSLLRWNALHVSSTRRTQRMALGKWEKMTTEEGQKWPRNWILNVKGDHVRENLKIHIISLLLSNSCAGFCEENILHSGKLPMRELQSSIGETPCKINPEKWKWKWWERIRFWIYFSSKTYRSVNGLNEQSKKGWVAFLNSRTKYPTP